jgi:hypothetical protein
MIRKYATATTVYFPLIKRAVMDFAVSADYTHVSGDVKISKDGAAAATATNAPTAVTMGSGAMWKLDLTSGEMTAKSVLVTVIDASTKAVEDQMLVIETYGEGQGEIDSQHWADTLYKRDMSAITGEASRSFLNAMRFIRNKWSIAGVTMTVTKEDDIATAWTSTLITTSGAGVITSADPT